jgi:ribosomal protein L22
VNIGDLVMRVLINDKAFDADLQKTAATSGTKAGKTLGSKMSGGLKGAFKGGKGELLGALGIGAGIGIATVAVGKLIDVIGKSVSAASDQREAFSLTAQVFEKNADAMKAWAADADDAFGQSSTEALNFASNFGNAFKNVGFTLDETTEKSKEMTHLAADLGSAFNKSSDEAATALRSGLLGESEPLRAFGVFLSEAAVKTEAMSMGIAKQGDVLTDNQKVLARYNIILRSTADSQGMFGRDTDSLADAQKSLDAAMENLAAEAGTQLVPVLAEMARTMKDDVLPAGRAVAQTFDDMGKQLDFLSGANEHASEASDILGSKTSALGQVLHDVFDSGWRESMDRASGAVEGMRTSTVADLGRVDGAFEDVGAQSKATASMARVSMKSMRDGSRALRDAFLADALAILADYYDPIEARQEQITIKKEAADLRQVIASKKSTKEQIADAKLRLGEIERRTNELLLELGVTGKATQKEISDAIIVWQKKARTAKGQAVEDIRAIIRQLFLLKLAADQAAGAYRVGLAGLPGAADHRASGGSVTAGMPYIVGERRRELFVPKVDGTIIPQVPSDWQAPAASGDAAGNTYNTTINYPDPSRGPEDFSRTLRRTAALG